MAADDGMVNAVAFVPSPTIIFELLPKAQAAALSDEDLIAINSLLR